MPINLVESIFVNIANNFKEDHIKPLGIFLAKMSNGNEIGAKMGVTSLHTAVSKHSSWGNVLSKVSEAVLLHKMASIGAEHAMSLIFKDLEKHGCVEDFINVKDETNRTPLWYALSYKHWSVSRLLILYGAHMSSLAVPDLFPRRCGFVDIGNQIFADDTKDMTTQANKVEHNSEPNQNNVFKRRRVDMIKRVVYVPKKSTFEKDTSCNDKSNAKYVLTLSCIAQRKGCDLLHIACNSQDTSLVNDIIKLRPSALFAKDRRSLVPFVYAVVGGNQEIVYKAMKGLTREHLVPALPHITWKIMNSLYSPHERARKLSQLMKFIRDSLLRKQHHRDENDLLNLYDVQPWAYGTLLSDTCWEHSNQNRQTLTQLNDIQFTIRPYNSISVFFNGSKLDDSCIQTISSTMFDLLEFDDVKKCITPLVMLGNGHVLNQISDKYLQHGVNLCDTRLVLDHSIAEMFIAFLIPDNRKEDNENDCIMQWLKTQIQTQNSALDKGLFKALLRNDSWEILKELLSGFFERELDLTDDIVNVLVAACRQNQAELFKKMIESLQIQNLSQRVKDYFASCVQLSAACGSENVVTYLLKKGAPLICEHGETVKKILGNNYQETIGVIEYALKGRNKNILNLIKNLYKRGSVSLPDPDVESWLKAAVKFGDETSLNTIIDLIFIVKKQTPSQDDWVDMLGAAASSGKENICISLLENVDLHNINRVEYHGMSLPHICTFYGMTKLFEKLEKMSITTLHENDVHGLTSSDYAFLMGHVDMIRTQPNDSLFVYGNNFGWFRLSMSENENMDRKEPVPMGLTHQYRMFDLSISGFLTCRMDKAATLWLTGSRSYMKYCNRSNESIGNVSKVICQAAANKCHNTLRKLIEILEISNENMSNNTILTREYLGKNSLAWAIGVENLSAITLLQSLVDVTSWKHSKSGENILHLAVKTGNISIVKLFLSDDQSIGYLRDQTDVKGVTPLATSVALGLHEIYRLLVGGEYRQQDDHAQHHTDRFVNENSDSDTYGQHRFKCVDCLLNQCIGWSRNYLMNITSDTIMDNSARPLHNEDIADASEILKCIMCWSDQNSLLFKSVLLAMGFSYQTKDISSIAKMCGKALHYSYIRNCDEFPEHNGETEGEFLYRVTPHFPLSFFKRHRDIVINNLVNTGENDNLLECSLVTGRFDIYEYILQLSMENSISLPSHLDRLSDTDGYPESIKWMIANEMPTSLHDTETRMSNSDVWLSIQHKVILKELEAKSNGNSILPTECKDKKFIADIDSFKRHTCFNEKGDIWLQNLMSSALIYGRCVNILDQDDPRLRKTKTVKVQCIAPESNETAKITIDSSGILLVTFKVNFGHTGVHLSLLYDDGFGNKHKELLKKEYINKDLIPRIENKVN